MGLGPQAPHIPGLPSPESWLPPIHCLGPTDPSPFCHLLGWWAGASPSPGGRAPRHSRLLGAPAPPLSQRQAGLKSLRSLGSLSAWVGVLVNSAGKLCLYKLNFLFSLVKLSLIKNILLLLSYCRSNKCSSQKSQISQLGIQSTQPHLSQRHTLLTPWFTTFQTLVCVCVCV